MANPYKSKSHDSSREKFHKLTGMSGGGHAHAGASHFKRAKGTHHEIKSEHPSRRKSAGAASGTPPKPRADKFARGGAAKKKGDVNIMIAMPEPGGHKGLMGGGPEGAAAMKPPPLGGAGGAPTPPPMGGGPNMASAAGSMGGMPAMGSTNPMSGGSGGSNPLAALGKGFKHGGKVKPKEYAKLFSKERKEGRDSRAKNLVKNSGTNCGVVEGGKNLTYWEGYAGGSNKPPARTEKMQETPQRRPFAKGGAASDKMPGMGGFPERRPPPAPVPATGPVNRDKGGRLTAGAATGMGRLEQAKREGRKHGK